MAVVYVANEQECTDLHVESVQTSFSTSDTDVAFPRDDMICAGSIVENFRNCSRVTWLVLC